ncbi:MAG TPA: phosphate ABC transporter permease subunit PstC [Cyanobacteria bacterium UBA8156]|jgi:phosphate transport system permease protein|nr:phosphate ABC transporter permease subunit PstC [Cyanobacteria bacterium UBA8156]
MPPKAKGLRRLDRFSAIVTLLGLLVPAVLGAIALEVAHQAVPALQEFGLGFLWGQDWNPNRDVYGALPHVWGTLVTSAIALGLAGPAGLGTAILLTEDWPWLPKGLQEALAIAVELLAAVPSVVCGLWSLLVLIPFLQGWTPVRGPGLLAAGITLAIAVVPLTAALSREALAAVSPALREGALALGASRWQTLGRVILPAALPGLTGAIALALGRALGETMAVAMTIGNGLRISLDWGAPASSIAALLANQFAEADGLQIAALMYLALVLFGLTALVNLLANLLRRSP